MASDGSVKPVAGEATRTRADTPEPADRLAHGRRLFGHFFWFVTGLVADRALPQLILFPLCMHLMGPDSFGRFIFALGVVSLVGLSPSKGLNNAILRNYAGVRQARRPLLLRTAFTMVIGVVVAISLAALVVCLGMRIASAEDSAAGLWIMILVIAMGARNIVTVGMVDLGVTRQFAQRALWQSAGSVLAFLALPAIFLVGDWGMPLGFAMGHVIALACLLVARQRTFLRRPLFDKGIAKRVTMMWVMLFASSFFFISGRYVHRTVLGAFQEGSYEAVSAFFAAAAVLNLFMMPLSITGVFGFQLLSAHASLERFSLRFVRRYAAAAIAGCVCFYGVTRWLAPWPLRLLYPNVAAEALAPMSIMLPGMAITVLMHASRPFVLKFSRWRTLLLIGITSFLVHVGGALLLIPRWGITGAAWAYCIGSTVVALAWFACFVIGFLRHGPRGNGQDVSIDNIDPG